MRNIVLLSALVLTVWLPANAAMNYIDFVAPTDDIASPSFWAEMIIDTVFGPLALGAVIYALDRRWQGIRVGYFEAMLAGLKKWIPLFFTLLVAEILVGLSFLLLIVPGIILALRYSFVGIVTVLENRSGSSARNRSADLMRGRMLAVLSIVVIPGFAIMIFLVGLAFVLDLAYEATEMTELQYYGIGTIVDCLYDVLAVFITTLLFACYMHAIGRPPGRDSSNDSDAPRYTSSQVDDGNPYMPPTA